MLSIASNRALKNKLHDKNWHCVLVKSTPAEWARFTYWLLHFLDCPFRSEIVGGGWWGAEVREEGMSCSRFYQHSQDLPLSKQTAPRAPQQLRTLLSRPACPLQLGRCPAAGATGLHRLPARLQMPGGRWQGQDTHPQEVWRRPEASTEVLGFHTGEKEQLRKPWREKLERSDALESI